MRSAHCTMLSLVVTLLAVATPAAFSQESAAGDDARNLDQPYIPLLETLIDHVGEGRIDDAIGFLEEETSKGVTEESRDSVKRMLSAIYGRGGKYDGHEIVAVRPISARLHRVYAMGYHERQPLVYTFTMYQFAGKWKINHVHWDDNVTKLAEKMEGTLR